MKHDWRFKMGTNRVMRFFIVLVCCGCSSGVLAESTEGTNNGLSIENDKYILDSDQAKPLMLDSELHPDFIKLLEPYPEALAAAQESVDSSGISLAGNVLILLGAAMGLKDTLSDKRDLDNNQFPEKDDDQKKALGVVIIGAIMSMVGSSQSRGAMDRAQKIFNMQKNKNSRTVLDQLTYTARIMTKLTQKGPSLSLGLVESKRNSVNSRHPGEIVVLTNMTYRF